MPEKPINLSLLLPNVFALIFHAINLYLFGLAISGEHAVILAWSAIISTIFCLRGDVTLLSSELKAASANFFYGCVTILLILSVVTFYSITFFANTPVNYYKFILCGALYAFVELIAALYLKKGNVEKFVFIKSYYYPCFTVALYVDSSFAVIDLWLLVLSISLVFVAKELIITTRRVDLIQTGIVLVYLKHFRDGFLPAVANTLVTILSNVPVVLIGALHGSQSAGLWINLYRIIITPFFYYCSAAQFKLLEAVSAKKYKSNKVRCGRLLWVSFEKKFWLITILVSMFILFFLSNTDLFLSEFLHLMCLAIVTYGMSRIILQFFETISQVVGRSVLVITVLFVESLIIAIFFIFSPVSISSTFYFIFSLSTLNYIGIRFLLFSFR